MGSSCRSRSRSIRRRSRSDERAAAGILRLPGTQARRSTRSRPTRCSTEASACPSRVVPRRPAIRMASLLRRRRSIRAAGTLREVLNGVGLVDQHAHGILRARPAPRRVPRALLREPRPPPVASHRDGPDLPPRHSRARGAVRLRAHRGRRLRARLALDPGEYASTLLRATGTEMPARRRRLPAARRRRRVARARGARRVPLATGAADRDACSRRDPDGPRTRGSSP